MTPQNGVKNVPIVPLKRGKISKISHFYQNYNFWKSDPTKRAKINDPKKRGRNISPLIDPTKGGKNQQNVSFEIDFFTHGSCS